MPRMEEQKDGGSLECWQHCDTTQQSLEGYILTPLGRNIITHLLAKLFSVWFLSSAAKAIVIDTKSSFTGRSLE